MVSFNGNKKYWYLGGGIAVVVLALVVLRYGYDFPHGLSSNASRCYSYNCPLPPHVTVGARVVGTRYGYQPPISYGRLNAKRGDRIEVTWTGTNATSCHSDWTRETSAYLPPTLYPQPMTKSFAIAVVCGRSASDKATGSLLINVR